MCKLCRHDDGVPDFEKAFGVDSAGKLKKFKKVVHENPCLATLFCVCCEENCHLQSVKNGLCKTICMKPARPLLRSGDIVSGTGMGEA